MGKQRKHVQGRRGEAFVELIRDVPRDRIACVSIDVHKYYHQVMIHNDYGEILMPSFRIDVFRSGFDHLCEVIDTTVAEHDIQVLFIGMEPTGHYYENLARYLKRCYPPRGCPGRTGTSLGLYSQQTESDNQHRLWQRQRLAQTSLSVVAPLGGRISYHNSSQPAKAR